MKQFRGAASTVILSVLASVFCTGVHAATYYVSPNGADNAKETSKSAAWKTINRFNKASLVADDSVLFQSSPLQGSLSFGSSTRGTATKPITISSYDEGTATIPVTGEERGITTSISSAVDFFGGAAPQAGLYDIGSNEVITSFENLVADKGIGNWMTVWTNSNGFIRQPAQCHAADRRNLVWWAIGRRH